MCKSHCFRIAFFLFSSALSQAALVSGNITSDTTWGPSGSPYNISGTVGVPPGVTLTILPGTTIAYGSGSQLTVAGRLISNGTVASPILFTGAQSANWNAVRFVDSSGSSLTNTIIENATFGLLLNGTSVPVVNNCIFRNNQYAFSDEFGYQPMLVENCTFVGNQHVFFGIRTMGQSRFTGNLFQRNVNVFTFGYYIGVVQISGNSFVNNGFVLKAPENGFGYGSVSLSSNFWGTQDSSIIRALIEDRRTDVTLQAVAIDPLLSASPESAGGRLLPLMAPPSIAVQPVSTTVRNGDELKLTAATNISIFPTTFQWFKDGRALADETNRTLIVGVVDSATAGVYSFVATNSFGSTASEPATVTVITASALSNISVRTTMAVGQTLFVGAVISGGTKNVMARAGGPSLNQFGLEGMADPNLSLYSAGTTPIAMNDDWLSSMAATFTSVGAFPYAVGSRDAALTEILNGSFTIQARGTTSGTVLVELYDVAGGTTTRLVNLSARNRVGVGSDVLIAGFVISGNGSKRLLIRGIGPGLAQFGVIETLANPMLQLYDFQNKLVATNDDWGASLSSTFASVSAFGLTNGSKDSALVATLTPGTYSVVVSGSDGGTGEGMIEIYELP